LIFVLWSAGAWM